MKKLIVILLLSAMVFTTVGCEKKEDSKLDDKEKVEDKVDNPSLDLGIDYNKVDPTFKAIWDEYESFVDEYVIFMNQYNTASSTEVLSMLGKYTEMARKLSEYGDKVDEMKESSDDDAKYAVEVQARITTKLLNVAAKQGNNN